MFKIPKTVANKTIPVEIIIMKDLVFLIDKTIPNNNNGVVPKIRISRLNTIGPIKIGTPS